MGNSKCFSLKSRPARRPRSRKGTATQQPSSWRCGGRPLTFTADSSELAIQRRGQLTRLVPLIGGAPLQFLGKNDSDGVVVSRWQPHGLHDQCRRRSDHGRGPPWCESDSDLPKRKRAPQSCARMVYRWTVDLLHPRHPERRPHEHLASTADGGRARSVDRPRDRHVARAARPAHGVVHGARSSGRRPVAVGARHGNANIAPGDPGPRAVHLDRGVRRWATARRVRRQTARRTLDHADHGEAHHR